MQLVSVRTSQFPWTWALLALVALDVVCRLRPETAGFTPWIDGVAVIVSLGFVRAVPLEGEPVPVTK